MFLNEDAVSPGSLHTINVNIYLSCVRVLDISLSTAQVPHDGLADGVRVPGGAHPQRHPAAGGHS